MSFRRSPTFPRSIALNKMENADAGGARSFPELRLRPWDMQSLVINSIGRPADVSFTVALARLLAVCDTELSLKFEERELQVPSDDSGPITEGKRRHRCCSARSRVEPSPLLETKAVWQVATCAGVGLCPAIKGLRKVEANPSFRVSSQLSAAAAYLGNLPLLVCWFPPTWKLDAVAAMMGAIAGKQVHILRWLLEGDPRLREQVTESVLSQPQPAYILKTLRKLPSDLASMVGGTTLKFCLGYGFPIDAQYFVPSWRGGTFEVASPLRAAASRGDVVGLQAWIDRGAFVMKDPVHSSALLLAVTVKEYRRLCTLLLDAGADPDVSFNGRTVFDTLIEFADYERLQWWAETMAKRRSLRLPIEISFSNWELLGRLAVKNHSFFQLLMTHELVKFSYSGTHANKSLLSWVVRTSINRMRLGHSPQIRAQAARPTSGFLQKFQTTIHPFLEWYVSRNLPLDIDAEARGGVPESGLYGWDLQTSDLVSPESAICLCLDHCEALRYSAREIKQCQSWYLALGASLQAVHGSSSGTCLHVWASIAGGETIIGKEKALEIVTHLLEQGADPNKLTTDCHLPPVSCACHPLVVSELLLHPAFDYQTLPAARSYLASPPIPFEAFNIFALDDSVLSEQQFAKAFAVLQLRYSTDPDIVRPGPDIGGPSLLLEVIKGFHREELQTHGTITLARSRRYSRKISTLLRLGADPNYVDCTSDAVPITVITLLKELCQQCLWYTAAQHMNATERLALLLQALFLTPGTICPLSAETVNNVRVSDECDTLLHAVCVIVPSGLLCKVFSEETLRSLIKTVIEVGSHVDVANVSGDTPLHRLRMRTKPLVESFIDAATIRFCSQDVAREEAYHSQQSVSVTRTDTISDVHHPERARFVKHLLRARNKEGQTPIHTWVSGSEKIDFPTLSRQLFPLLCYIKELDEGALHLADYNGRTVARELLFNVRWTSTEQFESGLEMLDTIGLLDENLWTDRTKPDGFTMLHHAIVHDRGDLIPFLLPPVGKCDPQALDSQGRSSFWHAAIYLDSTATQALYNARDLAQMED
jgi:hypothetical protein